MPPPLDRDHISDSAWLRVKTAASLDGRTALSNGVSQWITGEPARRDGHHWRARSCAVMIGIGTLLADNPRLTARDVVTSRQPLRIVVDRHLQIPFDAAVLEGGHVAVASGVRAVMQWELIPLSSVAERYRAHPLVRQAALAGGDDYELAFTAPRARRDAVAASAQASGTPVTRIGTVLAEPGLRLVDAQGQAVENRYASFDHFR